METSQKGRRWWLSPSPCSSFHFPVKKRSRKENHIFQEVPCDKIKPVTEKLKPALKFCVRIKIFPTLFWRCYVISGLLNFPTELTVRFALHANTENSVVINKNNSNSRNEHMNSTWSIAIWIQYLVSYLARLYN